MALMKMICTFGCVLLLQEGCGAGAKFAKGPSNSEETPASQGDACQSTQKSACDDLNQQIAALKTERDAAIDAKHLREINRINLEINYRLEKLEFIRDAKLTADNVQKLERKYAELRKVLASEANVETPVTTVAYKEREFQVVAGIMKEFGDLYIGESVRNSTGTQLAEDYSVPMPWGGYWYPLRADDLFGGTDSPMRKFDRATHIQSSDWEVAHKITSSETWEGLCGAWAVASVSTKEPDHEVIYNGESFSISDQKALLTKAFEHYPTKNYGIRYNGDAESDGLRSDIRPEAFHRIAESYLREQKKPFIIDDDAGIEVWNKPVYRMRTVINKDPEKANAFTVQTWLWLVRQRFEIKDDKTSDADRLAPPPLTYRLYVDPLDTNAGKFRVIAGEWLGDSLENHPDYVMVPVTGGKPESANPILNQKLNEIFSIAAHN